jgi:hypothetical protein
MICITASRARCFDRCAVGTSRLIRRCRDKLVLLYLACRGFRQLVDKAHDLWASNAGSDATHIRLSARRQGDEWVLNGSKMWITNGSSAARSPMMPISHPRMPIARFAVRLLTEALAPTNQLLGNPAALKKLIDTGGGNLARGIQLLFDDIRHNGGMPSQVDMTAFAVGKNLALSPGAVVFKNDVLELIQYAPATGQVYSRPLLLLPPQSNKFYMLALAPDKNIIEYLVKQGFTCSPSAGATRCRPSAIGGWRPTCAPLWKRWMRPVTWR